MHRRKGCLKVPSPMPSPDIPRKCVVFCGNEGLQVHVADEWDRTPTEPAPKLSYQDMLEFNAIQRSLPHANQLPDPYTGKPARHYLSAVPVGLLPLLNEESKSPPPSESPSPTPAFSPPPCSADKPAPSPVRMKSRFAFLPLLDTPSPPPEPKKEVEPRKEVFPLRLSALKLQAVPSPGLPAPSPFSLGATPTTSYFDRDVLSNATPALTRKKSRSIIVINDMEIEVDDDEEEEETVECPSLPSAAESSSLPSAVEAFSLPSAAKPSSAPSAPPPLSSFAIPIPLKQPPSSSSTLSSSVSSTTSTYSHAHTDYDFDHEDGGVQTLHSPFASPVSSVGEHEPWATAGSPSTSPIASSPIGLKNTHQNRSGCSCSPRRMRRGGGPSPLVVPSA